MKRTVTPSLYTADTERIVWWSYEDSLGLKDIGTTRVHILSDGVRTEPARWPKGELVPTISECFRDSVRDNVKYLFPYTTSNVTCDDGPGDLHELTEAEVRDLVKAAPTDAVIVVSEKGLRDYIAHGPGALTSPDIGIEPGFVMHDAAAVDRWNFPPMEFLVDQLVPRRGLTWLGGRAKRGKSLLAVYLGLAVACDRELAAGHFEVRIEGINVLYICREDPGGRLKGRIQDMTRPWDERPEPGRFIGVVRPRFDLSREEHMDWLHAVCHKRRIGLVILDTWTALSPQADPLGAKDQTVLAQAVANFSQGFDGAVVVLDHSRKNPPEGAKKGTRTLTSADILGPSQKWQAAEHIVMLADTSEAGRVEAFVEGKDTTTARFFLDVSPEGSGVEKFLYGGTVEEAAEGKVREGAANLEKVFQAIVKVDSTRQQIIDATGLGRATVTRHLRTLREAGRIGLDVDTYRVLDKEDAF